MVKVKYGTDSSWEKFFFKQCDISIDNYIYESYVKNICDMQKQEEKEILLLPIMLATLAFSYLPQSCEVLLWIGRFASNR